MVTSDADQTENGQFPTIEPSKITPTRLPEAKKDQAATEPLLLAKPSSAAPAVVTRVSASKRGHELKSSPTYRLADQLYLSIKQDAGKTPRIMSGLRWAAPWSEDVDLLLRTRIRVGPDGEPHVLLFSYGDVCIYATVKGDIVVVLILDASLAPDGELLTLTDEPANVDEQVVRLKPYTVAAYVQKAQDEPWVKAR